MRVGILTVFLGLIAFTGGAKAADARYQIKRTVGIFYKPVHHTCIISFDHKKNGNVEIRRRLAADLEVVESKSLKVEGDLNKFMSGLIRESRGWELVPPTPPYNEGLTEIINSVWDEQEKSWWILQQDLSGASKSAYALRLLDKQCDK